MGLKKILSNHLETTQYASRLKLRNLGKEQEGQYDSATVDRACRKLTEEGIIKPLINSKGFITDYVLNITKPVLKPVVRQNKPSGGTYEGVDDKLRELLKTVEFGEHTKLIDINKALKNKDQSFKKMIIEQYE